MRDPTILLVTTGEQRFSVGAPSLAGAIILTAACFAPGVTSRTALLHDTSSDWNAPGWTWPCVDHDPGVDALIAVPACPRCVRAYIDDAPGDSPDPAQLVWVGAIDGTLPASARCLAVLVPTALADDRFVGWDASEQGLELARALRR